MMTELWVCALLLVVSAGSVEVERLIPGRFIVTMDDTYDATSLRRHVESMEKRFDPDEMQILYVYDNLAGKSLTGYAAKLSARVAVQIRSAPGVKYIEPDKIFSIGSCISQTQAVWGLVRSNERGNYDSSAPQLYTYTPGGSGSGVVSHLLAEDYLIGKRSSPSPALCRMFTSSILVYTAEMMTSLKSLKAPALSGSIWWTALMSMATGALLEKP